MSKRLLLFLLLILGICLGTSGCGTSTYDPTSDLINELESGDPEVRRRAALDIAEMHHLPPEFIDRLLDLAENDPEPYVRSSAAEALRHAGPSVRSELKAFSAKEPDENVRRALIDVAEHDGSA